MKEKDERGALYHTIGWMSGIYLSSRDPREKRFIASLFKSLKEDFNISDANSLNQVIEDYYHGAEQI
jgi:hypothetical protein